ATLAADGLTPALALLYAMDTFQSPRSNNVAAETHKAATSRVGAHRAGRILASLSLFLAYIALPHSAASDPILPARVLATTAKHDLPAPPRIVVPCPAIPAAGRFPDKLQILPAPNSSSPQRI